MEHRRQKTSISGLYRRASLKNSLLTSLLLTQPSYSDILRISKQATMSSTNLHDPDNVLQQSFDDMLRHEHTSNRMGEREILLDRTIDRSVERGASDLIKPNSFLELTERPERAQRNCPDTAKSLSVSSSKQSVDVVGSSQPDEFASTSANQDQQHVQDQQTRAAEEWHAVQRSKFYKQFNGCI